MENIKNDPIIDSYYIITLRGNKVSEKYAKRCKDSCVEAGVDPNTVYYAQAVDGTSEDDVMSYPPGGHWIKYPEESYVYPPDIDTRKLEDLVDKSKISKTEAALFFSHYFLWRRCCYINKPIVILEHDAILLRELAVFPFTNCILYLGNESHEAFDFSLDQYVKPAMRSNGRYEFIDRTHAYAVDPYMARNLIHKAWRTKITTPVDEFIRPEDFCIIQPVPFIATVQSGEPTIKHTGAKSKVDTAWWDSEGFHSEIV